MVDRTNLAQALGDESLIRYFYLDKSALEVAHHMDTLVLTLSTDQSEIPFNAQVKSYFGALDQYGDSWIVKPVQSDEEMIYHRACMMAYLLDHETGTLAAPTSATLINGKRFRISKVVQKSVQISSYDYLSAPFINILRADLINRWIFFDEDRNPNNYLVISNAANRPFVVAIDYDKADLLSVAMKITGLPDKFGWLRAEKTRFLTLLRPEHFDGLSIDAFEDRLKSFCAIGHDYLLQIARQVFQSYSANPDNLANLIVSNILGRIKYVDEYFRSMFRSEADTKKGCVENDYSAFGQSFMAMHSKKK